jgi:hypothetical protein
MLLDWNIGVIFRDVPMVISISVRFLAILNIKGGEIIL